MTTRVVIADDHPLVLQALHGLLRSQPDMEVVGACRSGQAAIDAVQKVSPDVLVLDLSMPGMDGIDVLERLGADNNPTRVVVFTGNMDERRALECLRLGVAGVVLKESPPEMLLQAIRKVAAGDVWLEKRSHTQAVSLMLRQEEAKKRLATQLPAGSSRLRSGGPGASQPGHCRSTARHRGDSQTAPAPHFDKLELRAGRTHPHARERDRLAQRARSCIRESAIL
jgi:DNA-binding NarL/FixJ family response regulator